MNDAESISKFTLDFLHLKPSQGKPSDNAIASSISKNDLPALDDPEINILCPQRNTPSMSSSGNASGSISCYLRFCKLGSSSFSPSTKSSQSIQDVLYTILFQVIE